MSDDTELWVCKKCEVVRASEKQPESCPVCKSEQGYPKCPMPLFSPLQTNTEEQSVCPRHGKYGDPDETGIRSGKGSGFLSRLLLNRKPCHCDTNSEQ